MRQTIKPEPAINLDQSGIICTLCNEQLTWVMHTKKHVSWSSLKFVGKTKNVTWLCTRTTEHIVISVLRVLCRAAPIKRTNRTLENWDVNLILFMENYYLASPSLKRQFMSLHESGKVLLLLSWNHYQLSMTFCQHQWSIPPSNQSPKLSNGFFLTLIDASRESKPQENPFAS